MVIMENIDTTPQVSHVPAYIFNKNLFKIFMFYFYDGAHVYVSWNNFDIKRSISI